MPERFRPSIDAGSRLRALTVLVKRGQAKLARKQWTVIVTQPAAGGLGRTAGGVERFDD
jgi:hypothetical protein